MGCGGGGDSGPAEDPPSSLTLTLERDPSSEPARFLARISALDAQSETLVVEAPTITLSGGQLIDLAADPQGRWVAEIVADNVDSAVTVQASLLGTTLSIERSAVVLTSLDERFGQPELVPGLVNTAGWEDSSEVSPDGQWLLVGTYTPVDILTCLLGGLDPALAACNESLGPIAGPERPQLPGANRILGPNSILHQIPELCLVGENGGDFSLALPPVSAYGFRKLNDGTFGEPFAISYEMGGYTSAPFGFSFVGSPNGPFAELVFAHTDLSDPLGIGFVSNLFVAPVILGLPQSLGSYSCPSAQVLLENHIATRLPIPPLDTSKGNPFFELDQQRAWFDDESLEQSLVFFSDRLSETPVTYSVRQPAAEPVNVGAEQSFQPHMHAGRLYWARNFRQIQSAALIGPDPAETSSFGPLRIEFGLGPAPLTPEETPIGGIVGVGEPSLAIDETGLEWLYFVVVRRTATGLNADIARVPERRE